jgi:hypothetical protein
MSEIKVKKRKTKIKLNDLIAEQEKSKPLEELQVEIQMPLVTRQFDKGRIYCFHCNSERNYGTINSFSAKHCRRCGQSFLEI